MAPVIRRWLLALGPALIYILQKIPTSLPNIPTFFVICHFHSFPINTNHRRKKKNKLLRPCYWPCACRSRNSATWNSSERSRICEAIDGSTPGSWLDLSNKIDLLGYVWWLSRTYQPRCKIFASSSFLPDISVTSRSQRKITLVIYLRGNWKVRDCLMRSQLGLSENVGYIPNEIAI